MEVEHGLLQAHGANFRLTRYFLPTEVSQRNSDPLSWPRLGVTVDGGPDNTCLIHTMLYKWHANVDLYLDDSHGFKNDMKGVYKQSGEWHWVRCMMSGFNVWLSPWWEAMRYAQVSDAIGEVVPFLEWYEDEFSWSCCRRCFGIGGRKLAVAIPPSVRRSLRSCRQSLASRP